jgi:hypothetical protein
MVLSNYIKLNNGIIKQDVINNKIDYNIDYSNKYNNYGEKCNYLSYLRLGILLGVIKETPNSILDVGYGNCSFLNSAKNCIKECYGYDISSYPVSNDIIKVDNIFDKYYDIICFFDSLEHFEDINFINKLDCKYIFISLPWCHYFNDEWFKTWYHRREDEHLYHFNDKSLINFFEENGYKNIYISNFEDTIRKNNNDYPNILSGIFCKI